MWFNLNLIWLFVFNHKTFFILIRFQYGLFRVVEATRLSPSRNIIPSYEFKIQSLLVYFNLHFFFLLGQCNEKFTYSNIFIQPLTRAVDKHTLGDKKRHFQVQVQGNLGKMKRFHSVKVTSGKNFHFQFKRKTYISSSDDFENSQNYMSFLNHCHFSIFVVSSINSDLALCGFNNNNRSPFLETLRITKEQTTGQKVKGQGVVNRFPVTVLPFMALSIFTL